MIDRSNEFNIRLKELDKDYKDLNKKLKELNKDITDFEREIDRKTEITKKNATSEKKALTLIIEGQKGRQF